MSDDGPSPKRSRQSDNGEASSGLLPSGNTSEQATGDSTQHTSEQATGDSTQHTSEQATGDSTQHTSEQATGDSTKHGKSYARVTKEDLYSIIALWMEDFGNEVSQSNNDNEVSQSSKKVGAVLVLPNDVVYAADCSRDGVHAVQRLLMKYCGKAEGCKMFVSRKPCPTCAKLLVQAKVQRVLFLPYEPEYNPSPDKDSKMKQVDNMFTASAIAQTRYVFQVTQAVLDDAEIKTPSKNTRQGQEIDTEKERLKEKYRFDRNPNWKGRIIEEQLPWPGFDTEVGKHVKDNFIYAIEWIARVRVLFGSGLNYNFELAERQVYTDDDEIAFKPVSNDLDFVKKGRYFIAIARFLSERTDDPKAGVGAVIVSKEMEILGLGWNGFPLKALYGEFPRAARSDKSPDKKAPYIIHAEQNAFLMRNQKEIKGSILFVSGRPPCNECTPLIAMQGVETVVMDTDEKHDINKMREEKEYTLFPKKVKENKFFCYRTRKINMTDSAGDTRKNLFGI